MALKSVSRSQEIRAKVGHPIIDADGHTLELSPLIEDYIKEVGGADALKHYKAIMDSAHQMSWFQMSEEERRDTWTTATAWWFKPTHNTLDRAAAHFPRLLHERMDELGLDYSIIYPTLGLGFLRMSDEEMRRIGCRAMNAYHADIYREYSDRLTPAAAIPMHTPEEAIDELTYSIEKLGLKVPLIPGHVMRPIPKIQREHPEAGPHAFRIDTFGLDSDYDYDPVWRKCLELKVSPATHSSAFFWNSIRSLSNYMSNHLNTFSHAHEAFCKSLFMGGVTRRFPSLKLAFLEGGVGWACTLYSDMVGHWEKRNARAIQDLDPANLDQKRLLELMETYGDGIAAEHREDLARWFAVPDPAPQVVDDWSRVPMEVAEEIKDLFVEPFYFGCEADDPINAWAFNTRVNPFGARLKALFSSDIGHWDVPNMREVVEEAYELVEHELITEEDFRDFTFTNAVELYGSTNPDFFKDTMVEVEAAKILGK